MKRIACLLSVSLSCTLITGCSVSIQSSQFNFVRQLFEETPADVPMNWFVSWQGQKFMAYAINQPPGILFVNNNGLLVSFDGWQITSLALPKDRKEKKITLTKRFLENDTMSLEYSRGVSVISSHICEAWDLVYRSNLKQGYKQVCRWEDVAYSNIIVLNGKGEIVSLRYTVGAPPNSLEILFAGQKFNPDIVQK